MADPVILTTYPLVSQDLKEWGRGLHRLCEDLPLSLDGVDDERRGEKVAKIREIIASQWARTIEIARCHGPESIVIQERVSEMNTILQGLMKDYAQVLSFAPNPDLSTTAGVTDMVNLKIGSPNDSSTTESPSSEKEVPFDFKFLQVGDDVWTVLQVAHSGDSADGYVLFLSCAEWWRFKTPFYAWFSRSYESMLLPQLWDWGFTHGHVGRRSGYRGSVKKLRSCFPLDVTTLPALVSALAVLLAAKGLSRPLLECAYKILKGLGDAALITETFRLLSNEEGSWIDVVNGEFTKSELKSVLSIVDVGFPRFKKRSFADFDQTIDLANFVMTCLLLCPENSENRRFNRMVKRLVHLWCQSTENSLIDGEILQTECPDPNLRSKIHPFMRTSRRMGNPCVRQALCKQFLARGGGYVTTRHEVSLKRLGIVGEKSSLANLASTEFVARQLQMCSSWIENHFAAVATKKYGFKVINFTLDESRVCQQQVLPILLKMGGRLIPAPTQLVPESGSGMDAGMVLNSLSAALKGCLPNPGAKLLTTSETWGHREYRQTTKNLLLALGNALVYLLPAGFKVSDCKPANLLHPRGSSAREKLIKQELLLLTGGMECERLCHFLWSEDADKICRIPDFYLDPKAFYRLTFSGDEGTDVFLMFQHLAHTGSWVCFWPDLPHKFQRKQAMALASDSMAKTKLKQFMKVFRSNRAPFATSRFGKALKESKQRLIEELKRNPDNEILEMFMPGIARDLGCDPASFTASHAIRALAHRASSFHVQSTECKDVRWGAWIDHAQAWDRAWHVETMVMLYAMWEAGENPWTGTLSTSVDATDERSYSIKKIRWQVLSDDQNQNYMRSMISIFKQARVFVGKFVSDVQNQDEASLAHAMDLASGKRMLKIMVKTLAEAFTWEGLDYIGALGGDEDAEDIRGFHSSLLLAHLGYLNEGHQYHKSYPWKIVLGTQPCFMEDLMTEMQSLWSFITDNIDTLSPKSVLYKACFWTRAQCFREVFVVAESNNFDARLASSDGYWLSLIQAVCGITHEMFGSLLTSVPCEMTFNDLRDACRRFSKQEVTTPVNIHSIVARSCSRRIAGVETLIPEGSDWSRALGGKTVKKQVFDSSRCTDLSLGLNTSGLTRKKADGDLTKPHIFSYRLQLLRILHEVWLEDTDHEKFNVEMVFKKLWKSGLLSGGVVFRFCAGPRKSDQVFMTLVAGPYAITALKMDFLDFQDDEHALTILALERVQVVEIPLTDISELEVGITQPKALAGCRRLGWKLQGDWMTISTYVAYHGIYTIKSGLLQALCTDLRLRGHQKLDHKRRAELFMKHMECPAEHISSVLESLPEKVPRKRSQEGEDEQCMDNFNEEGDEQLEGEQDDDEYQEMVAEMSVLQEDDTALPEPAEVENNEDVQMAIVEQDGDAKDDGGHSVPEVREPRKEAFRVGVREKRGDPDLDVPPCCRSHWGFPKDQSPYIQVHLPKGYKFQGKASRACCFADEEGKAVPNGTSRSRKMAVQSVQSWSWQWWESLTPVVQSSLRGHKDVKKDGDGAAGERPAKRART